MVEGNMGEFESQIKCSNLEENFWLKACVFETTHNLSLVSCLLRDEQRLSLGSLLTVVIVHFKPSTKHEKGIY
jgi:hypothetical protein